MCDIVFGTLLMKIFLLIIASNILIYSHLRSDEECDKSMLIITPLPDKDCENIRVFIEGAYPEYQVNFQHPDDTHQICLEDRKVLPELTPFFPTLLAEPHIIGYSAGYRSYDEIFKSTIPISIGDQFSLYRFDLDPCGSLYFGIEACVWAIFDARTKSLSLINSDYYVAIPFTYFYDAFSARLRIFHESSHLGDEFLLENPKVQRLNPSMEAIDLSVAYEPLDRLVFFAGYTRTIRSDESFRVKPNYLYYGFNYHLDFAKIEMFQVEGMPYVATYLSTHNMNKWICDKSIAIGYEWTKCYGKKVRAYILAHDGYSEDGQFGKRKSRFISIQLLYSY